MTGRPTRSLRRGAALLAAGLAVGLTAAAPGPGRGRAVPGPHRLHAPGRPVGGQVFHAVAVRP
jgi:hypothetical protein